MTTGKLLRAAAFVCSAIVIVATIAVNLYLMLTRPVVAQGTPANHPANWLCQRVWSSSYCVALSPTDLRI